MFRHAHEKETGRTSSIGQEIVGVREAALVHGERWQDVMGQSDKVPPVPTTIDTIHP